MGYTNQAEQTGADSTADNAIAQAFVDLWIKKVTASELSTAQPFLIAFCAILGVEQPHPTPEQDYMFERPITFRHGDGSSSAGRIDCYRRGSFCLEAKKQKTGISAKGFDDGLLRARSQAENYARALPAEEGRLPFLLVIDAFGVSAEQLRSRYPAVYQWLLERVKPERNQNNRATYRDNWWLFGEPRKVLRKQLKGLPRNIATVETAKHRTFQFLDASILPDNRLIAIASSDPVHLGILSSRLHETWALATGGTLEDRPVYTKSICFETFLFPAEDTGLTAELKQKISTLAEQIDAHRKRALGLLPSNSGAPSQPDTLGRVLPGTDFCAFGSMRATAIPAPATTDIASTTTTNASSNTKTKEPVKLTLTALYNVMESLREGRELTEKERAIHQQGLVGVLKELHDELDAAVLQAYDWNDLVPVLGQAQGEGELLARLVALNAQRAELDGETRWRS